MKRLLAASLLAFASAPPAAASTIPLVDLPPNLVTVSAGGDPQIVHLSADYALGTWWGQGWIVGGMASYDISGKRNQRESQTMGALRITRHLGGTFPFSIGATLSVGMNLVDPAQETPPDQQIYASPYLLWVQPALNISTPILGDVFNDQLWLRATFGPVLGRWTSGTFYTPFFSPNVELAYRILPAHEIVLGGGFVPWGLGWRGAF
ncbi:MAG: hypothetical protein JWM80_3146 [Cyanobacteria bacterium RYN_339]|nr:hypothetical protein [Cyanobacteria bacterium RYN_339]